METLEFLPLHVHEKPPEDAIDVLVGEVPYLPMRRQFDDHMGESVHLVAIDEAHRHSHDAMQWYLSQSKKCTFYIEAKLESLPALAHYLSYFPYGNEIMRRLRNAYVARPPKAKVKPNGVTVPPIRAIAAG